MPHRTTTRQLLTCLDGAPVTVTVRLLPGCPATESPAELPSVELVAARFDGCAPVHAARLSDRTAERLTLAAERTLDSEAA